MKKQIETIILSNAYRYKGELLEETDSQITLLDFKSGKRTMIAKKMIASRESEVEQ